jgi:hypothetical protein
MADGDIDAIAIDIEVRGYFPCRSQPRELASSPTAESANSDAPLKRIVRRSSPFPASGFAPTSLESSAMLSSLFHIA